MQDIEIEFEELQTAGALGEGLPAASGRSSSTALPIKSIQADRNESLRTPCEAYPVGQTLELTRSMTKCLSAIKEENFMVSQPSQPLFCHGPPAVLQITCTASTSVTG